MAEEKKTTKAKEAEATAPAKAAEKAAEAPKAEAKAEAPKKKPAAKKPAAKKPAEKKTAEAPAPAAEKKAAPVAEKPEKPAAKKPVAAAPKPVVAAKPAKEKPVLPKPTVTYQGTGRRKNAIARVRIFAGTGKIYCNGQFAEDYFGRDALKTFVEAPLRAVDGVGKFDVIALLTGGGLSGQAGALRLGIARALLASNEELRGDLKRAGLLSRDPRMVERKKYGLKKARKRPQFSKR